MAGWQDIDGAYGLTSPTRIYLQKEKDTCCVSCGVMVVKAIRNIEIDEKTLIAQINHPMPLGRGYEMSYVVAGLNNSHSAGYRVFSGACDENGHPKGLSNAEVLKYMTSASAKRPVIVSIESNQFAHAVVCTGLNGTNLVILDPKFNVRLVSFDSFPFYSLRIPGAEAVSLYRFGSSVGAMF